MIRTRLLPLAVVAALAIAAGCAWQDSTTAPERPAASGLLGEVSSTLDATLLACEPLSVAPVAQEVGPRGGKVRIGPHLLEVPRGALRSTTVITAEIPADPVNSIRFGPEGLRFAKAATLTMSYANCDETVTLPKKIAFTTDALAILEVLLSDDDAKSRSVSAPVDHFSRYAVAW